MKISVFDMRDRSAPGTMHQPRVVEFGPSCYYLSVDPSFWGSDETNWSTNDCQHYHSDL